MEKNIRGRIVLIKENMVWRDLGEKWKKFEVEKLMGGGFNRFGLVYLFDKVWFWEMIGVGGFRFYKENWGSRKRNKKNYNFCLGGFEIFL